MILRLGLGLKTLRMKLDKHFGWRKPEGVTLA